MSIPGLTPSLSSPLGSPLRPDPRRTPGGMERPGTPAPGSERAGLPARTTAGEPLCGVAAW